MVTKRRLATGALIAIAAAGLTTNTVLAAASTEARRTAATFERAENAGHTRGGTVKIRKARRNDGQGRPERVQRSLETRAKELERHIAFLEKRSQSLQGAAKTRNDHRLAKLSKRLDQIQARMAAQAEGAIK